MYIKYSLLRTAVDVVKRSGAYLYDELFYYGNKVETREYAPMKNAA